MTAFDETDIPASETDTPPAIPPGARRLTKADIQAVNDLQEEEVYIPEWQGTVLVRALNRDQFYAAVRRAMGKGRKQGEVDPAVMEAAFLSDSLVDPKYSIFEIADLMKKNMGAVQRIVDVANRLSGMTKEEREAALEAFRR